MGRPLERTRSEIAPPLAAMSPAELLDLVRSDDQAAYGEIVSRFWAPLVRYALSIIDDHDTAEDLVQHALVRLWERRARWEPGSEPGVLLYRMVRNRGLNRRARVATRRDKAPDVRQLWARHPETPFQSVLSQEMIDVVRGAIESLPTQRREVLILSRFHGMSRTEVAEVMNLAPQTVANHLSLALAQLRKLLREYR